MGAEYGCSERMLCALLFASSEFLRHEMLESSH